MEKISIARLPFTNWVPEKWTVGLVVIFLGGAYLRFRGLTFQSYWDDELFSMAISDPANSLNRVARLTLADVHPPLFQVLLWCWLKVFGFSEASGRLFSAIWGASSIFVMYFLGRKVGNRRTGFVSALVCMVNMFHLHYSQEVRSYSMLFFLSALSLLLFIRVIDNPSKRNSLAYSVFSIALAYTHYFGFLILFSQMLFLFLQKMRVDFSYRRVGLLIGIGFFVALLPLVPFVVKKAAIKTFWIKAPQPDFAIDYFKGYFSSASIALCAALSAFYGIYQYSTSTERRRGVIQLLLLCIAVVFILPYVRSLIGTPMLTARNTIASLPAILVLVAIGFDEVRDAIYRFMVVAIFSVLSLLLIFHQPPYYRTVTKPQIREAAQALVDAKPDPGNIYAPDEVVNNFNIYLAWLNAPFHVQPLSKLYEARKEKDLSGYRFWLIDGRSAGPIFRKIIDPKFQVLQKGDFFRAGYRFVEIKN